MLVVVSKCAVDRSAIVCLVHSALGLYTPPTAYGALSYRRPLVARVMLLLYAAGCLVSRCTLFIGLVIVWRVSDVIE